MKQTKQVKTLKRLVGMLLVLVMAFQMPLGMVRAEATDIGEDVFNNSEKQYVLPAGTYGTIVVPEGCRLIIEDAVTATTVTLETGSFLEIRENIIGENNPGNTYGRLSCTTLNASQNANLCLDIPDNAPSVNGTPLQLYSWSDEANDFVDLVSGDGFWNAEFHYEVPPEGAPMWMLTEPQSAPEEFFVSFEGMEEGMGIRVAYSYDGNDWTDAINKTLVSGDIRDEEGLSGFYEYNFSLDNIPAPNVQGKIPVTIKVEVNPGASLKKLDGPYEMNPCIDENWSIDNTNSPYTFEYKYTHYDDNYECGSHNIHLAMKYLNSGKGAIVNEVNDYLYAYSNIDWNGNGSSDADDMKYALASELYVRFINPPLYEDFGIPRPENGEPGVFSAGVQELISRIDLVSNGSFAAKDRTENIVNLTQYTATIHWGVDESTGQSVESTIPVYEISDSYSNPVLICTDFNKENGTCASGSLYIRDIATDTIDFSSSTITNDQSENKDEGLLVLADYANVVAGGNGLLMMPMNTDGIYSFHVYPMAWAEVKGFTRQVDVRVMKPGNDYVVIHGSGETNKVDGMGLNGSDTDTIWETGNNCTARVYVGYSTLTLMPVEDGIVSNNASDTKITGVELLDSSMQDGVTITQNGENFDLTFESNFYDSVPLKVTYENGDSRNLTIERIGLVINYFYLEDRGPGSSVGEIEYDCKPGSRLTFDYDYQAGEQIIVYATYYHPTNDPTTGNLGNVILHLKYNDGSEVYMPSNAGNEWTNNGGSGYLGASGGGVATTTFFIDFVEAGNGTSNTTTSIPGFYATVLNADYDDANTYGGTQIGSGLGVYWDGEITFVTR